MSIRHVCPQLDVIKVAAVPTLEAMVSALRRKTSQTVPLVMMGTLVLLVILATLGSAASLARAVARTLSMHVSQTSAYLSRRIVFSHSFALTLDILAVP
jgi:hypothetical protein